MIRLLAQRSALVDSAGRIASDWYSFLTDMVKAVNKREFMRGTAAVSHTGSAETEAVSVSAQPGTSGTMRLAMAFSSDSTANVKSAVIAINGTTVQTITIDNSTETQSAVVVMVGMTSSQYIYTESAINCAGSGGVSVNGSWSSSATITVTLQLGTTTDTIALESWALTVERA